MRVLTSVFIALGILLAALLGYFIHSMGQLAGGHKAIKAYQYPVTKYELEKAVDSVLRNNPNVKRDTVDNYYTYVDSNKQEHRVHDNYYNDGIGYLTVNISRSDLAIQYVIRYYADSAYWSTSKISELFIAYANDQTPNNRDIKRLPTKVITRLFEDEFLEKVNKQLGKSYVVVP